MIIRPSLKPNLQNGPKLLDSVYLFSEATR
jgi:hypothetical protein